MFHAQQFGDAIAKCAEVIGGDILVAFGADIMEGIVSQQSDWASFERELPTLGQPYFFSTRATRTFWDSALGGPGDVVLVFGRETGGLPADLHDRYRDRFVTMPLVSPHVRSLNLSTAVGIAAYEVLRQRRANSR